MFGAKRLVLSTFLLLVLAGCTAQSLLSWEASDRRRPHYQVQSGDTLYSIAWDYGMDFRRLATVNQLHPPYPIRPGDILRLPKGYDTPQVVASNEPVASPAPRAPSTTARKPSWQNTRPVPPKPADGLAFNAPAQGGWAWPNNGKVVKNWGARKHRRSGIDIAARPDSKVLASAAGQVVYSGGGLARYGQLVIVKHDESMLSAYAYNNKILVKKGETVAAGQQLALSGRSPDGIGAVHFEIRKDGRPVDVMQYLRAANSS